MKLRSLLKKEAFWSKHNAIALVFLLVLLPGMFAFTTVAFQQVIPRDAPIAIVSQEGVSQDDIDIVRGGIALFADPQVYDSRESAMRALNRERVYAVIDVPPRISDPNQTNATFYLSVDEAIVPYEEPSRAIVSIMGSQLDRSLPADVDIQRVPVGGDHTLSEFLVVVCMMLLVMLFAFTYVPYNLAKEEAVLERLRVESSLDAVVASKLVYFTALMAIPIVAFFVAIRYLNYSLTPLNPWTVGTLLLTFVYLTAISMSVMILTKFSSTGRFANVVVMFGFLLFSNLAYPVGFFSPLRKTIARSSPLHYSMIIVRSGAMKDFDMTVFTDWLLGLVGVTAITLVGLKVAIEHYKRTI